MKRRVTDRNRIKTHAETPDWVFFILVFGSIICFSLFAVSFCGLFGLVERTEIENFVVEERGNK